MLSLTDSVACSIGWRWRLQACSAKSFASAQHTKHWSGRCSHLGRGVLAIIHRLPGHVLGCRLYFGWRAVVFHTVMAVAILLRLQQSGKYLSKRSRLDGRTGL